MIGALRAAGFPGAEEAGGVVYARLSANGPEFRAEPGPGSWMLSLSWPVRASAAQMAGWMAAHPGAVMDIHAGETRVRMRAGANADDLARWAALAEAAVVAMAGWRRLQRAPGEGM
jgi:hypothetical protein